MSNAAFTMIASDAAGHYRRISKPFSCGDKRITVVSPARTAAASAPSSKRTKRTRTTAALRGRGVQGRETVGQVHGGPILLNSQCFAPLPERLRQQANLTPSPLPSLRAAVPAVGVGLSTMVALG